MSAALLAIRTDANHQIGTGHLIRCLALAHEWKRQAGDVCFFMTHQSQEQTEYVMQQGFPVSLLNVGIGTAQDAQETLNRLKNRPVQLLLLDGYQFGPTYQHALKQPWLKLALLDDMAHYPNYQVDAIINPNLDAEQLSYLAPPDSLQLLGSPYAILRADFLTWQAFPRQTPLNAKRVLVTLGGSDPTQQTLKVVKALNQLQVEDLEVEVVIGNAFENRHTLENLLAQAPYSAELSQQVSAQQMASRMAWADLAVSAAGSTCWELAFMGVPSLLLIVADNQKGIAHRLAQHQIVELAGWYNKVSSVQLAFQLRKLMSDAPRRQVMSQAGRQLIDGQGAQRIIGALKEYLR